MSYVIRSHALPEHTFAVVAMDGNPIPKRVRMAVLWLGTELCSGRDEPSGVWILGETADDDRHHGTIFIS